MRVKSYDEFSIVAFFRKNKAKAFLKSVLAENKYIKNNEQ